jgi:hypothetical protein
MAVMGGQVMGGDQPAQREFYKGTHVIRSILHMNSCSQVQARVHRSRENEFCACALSKHIFAARSDLLPPQQAATSSL